MKKVYSFKFLKIAFKHCKLLSFTIMFLNIIKYIIPTFKLIYLANFIDVTKKTLSKGQTLREIYISLLLLISIHILEYLITITTLIINNNFEQLLNCKMETEIVTKISNFRYELFENEKICNLIDRVREGCENRFTKGFKNIMKLIEYSIRILGVIIVVMYKNIFVGIIVCFALLIILPLAKKAGEDDYNAYEEVRKHFRKAKVFREILVNREFVGERTLFSFAKQINNKWRNHYNKARKIYAKTELKNQLRTNISSSLTTIISIIIAFSLLPSLISNNISSGLYISIITSVFELVHMMSWNLTNIIEEYVSNKYYLLDYDKFSSIAKMPNNTENILRTKNENYSKSKESIKSDKFLNSQLYNIYKIKFSNVYFKYPNSDNYIIHNFNYEFVRNKHYALVGENGAGKTTIVKLILGFYKNYKGNIFINDKELRTFTQYEINSMFSVVLQDFVKYQINIRDNISIGAKGKLVDDNQIIKILKLLGLWDKLNKLENGLDCSVGKLDKDGIDLSGGEWQKIAIARSLVSNANIHILDEPTASLDPISERNLYNLYNNLFEKKTTILITHRLGNTKNVDEILVINNGQICEKGNHKELIKLRGKYYDMYEKQRSWYNE